MAARKVKKIKLALQGGGAHGAFSWGVIDKLLEDGRIEIEAVVGTSAGAMNAAVVAYGLLIGGPEEARRLLEGFWKKVSDAGRFGMLQPTPLDKMMSRGNMDYSPLWHWFNSLSELLSPYQLNPLNFNPLKNLLDEMVDFDVLRKGGDRMKLFVCATNVRTGRLRVFDISEITPDAIMASACLPMVFQAVEIEGESYWDGGYCGNPPIFPLIYEKGSNDILIVQINPINIPETPKTSAAIVDRINTLSFNSSLMREMRAILFVSNLLDAGELNAAKYPRVFVHTIDAEEVLAGFNVSSKLNPDWDFLCYLRDLGRAKAAEFIEQHLDKIGVRSSADIAAKFM
jgi:NTE family protein